MAEKYIVQNNATTKVIYIGGCQSAAGGRKAPSEPADRYPYVTTNPQYSPQNKNGELEGVQAHGAYHRKNYRARKKSRRKAVEELIINNFDPANSAMLTLTFSNQEKVLEASETVVPEYANEDQELFSMLNSLEESQEPIIDTVRIYDPAVERYKKLAYCNKLFKQFIQRMKYRFPLFNYVAVMARQDNGNWHYHMICNLNFVPFDELRTIWRNGAVYFRSFKQTGMNGLWKSIRYLQKSMGSAELKGAKGYLCSKGLNRNLVYRTWMPNEQAQADAIKKSISGSKPSCSYTTTHCYSGFYPGSSCTGNSLTATTKYFKFFCSNAAQFPKLPNAYIPKESSAI